MSEIAIPPTTAQKEDQAAGAASPALSSWAVPTKHDDEIWESLTREQQLASLQGHFSSDDCTTPSSRTVTEIVARARANRCPS